MKAIHVSTESLSNPIGLSIVHPRLFRNAEGGIKQSAFEILRSSSFGREYSSGKVVSSSRHYDVPFPLHSREKIKFKIRLFDENGLSEGYGGENYFERGLLNKEDFTGSFIAGDYSPKKGKDYPVDYFRKEFDLPSILSARLYVTSHGLYQVFLNG